jgi:hypothetical protein
MFGGDIVESIHLRAGAYPRRYRDTLGAQLEVSLREGSRESTSFSARAGGTSVAVAGEGPIGRDGRGSWIAGARNSYRSWPPINLSSSDVGFAFADVHAKLAYALSETQHVSVTALAGRSALDAVDEPLQGPLSQGTDRAGLLTVGWRSILRPGTVLRQRASFVGQDLQSMGSAGQLDTRANRAFAYRTEALHSIAGGLLEGGADVTMISGARSGADVLAVAGPDAVRAAWTTRAAYVDFERTVRGRLSFGTGVRLSDSTLRRDSATTPWIRGAWRMTPRWTLTASSGASRQFPELDAAPAVAGSPGLVPERATLADVGIEQRLPRVAWQVTVFDRMESGILGTPGVQPILSRSQNALSGSSRGIELVIMSRGTRQRSAWMSYAYAAARQADRWTGETFWSDADRRHAFNLTGLWRIGQQSSAGITLRAASGAPIPGYFDLRGGRLYAGAGRNDVRLPTYCRVDGRVQRTLFASRHAVTLYGEVVNALNRRNEGLTEGRIDPTTGEAIGFSRPFGPRRVSIGVDVKVFPSR